MPPTFSLRGGEAFNEKDPLKARYPLFLPSRILPLPPHLFSAFPPVPSSPEMSSQRLKRRVRHCRPAFLAVPPFFLTSFVPPRWVFPFSRSEWPIVFLWASKIQGTQIPGFVRLPLLTFCIVAHLSPSMLASSLVPGLTLTTHENKFSYFG